MNDMKEALRIAWALTKDVTPLAVDCGAYCEGACCKPDEDGQGGVRLFPGEEEMLDGASWGVIEGEGNMLLCAGRCLRDKRPLGCRIFPLTPVRADDQWQVRLDRRAWAMCPLMRHGMKGLRPDFVNNVRESIRIIAQVPEGEAFLRAWAKEEKQYNEKLP